MSVETQEVSYGDDVSEEKDALVDFIAFMINMNEGHKGVDSIVAEQLEECPFTFDFTEIKRESIRRSDRHDLW